MCARENSYAKMFVNNISRIEFSTQSTKIITINLFKGDINTYEIYYR